MTGVRVADDKGVKETLTADAYVVCLSSYTPRLLAPIGVSVAVYPAKGYSATLRILDPAAAPTVSITDDAKKIVFTRLGDRLRVAGTAELSGYGLELNPVRCEALTRRAPRVVRRCRRRRQPRVLGGSEAGDSVECSNHRPHPLREPLSEHGARNARLDDELRIGQGGCGPGFGRRPAVDFAFLNG